MELIFIGTGSGKTSLTRNHSALLFRDSSSNILIDAGDGISKSLLIHGIEFNKITDIIFSHYHSDHLAGLPSLLTQMIIGNRKKTLNLYTHEDLVNPLKLFIQTSFIFLETLNFKVRINGFKFRDEMGVSEGLKFVAKQNSHITNKHNLSGNGLNFISSSFLFLIRKNKIIYTSDIGNSNDLFLFKETEPDTLITESTHIAFSKIEEAELILSPNKTYLTHIEVEQQVSNWWTNLTENKKNRFVIAEDGMRVDYKL